MAGTTALNYSSGTDNPAYVGSATGTSRRMTPTDKEKGEIELARDSIDGDPIDDIEDDEIAEIEPDRSPACTVDDANVPERILDRVLSRTSASSIRPGPPPDGGFHAWMSVLCAHFVIMDTWGMISSFGTFQTYYVAALQRPPSDIAWIGSFQIFLLFFIGTFTGRLTDAGYFRFLIALGTVLQMVGVFTTAQGSKYWHFFLSQGVVLGLGNGCLFCPTLATVSTYFSSKRSLAVGIVASGSATGGLVFPTIVRQLLPKVGFPWTMRTIGFIQLATLLVTNIGLRPRLPPRKTGRIVEWPAFKEPQYAFYAAASFFCFWGVYIVFFYIASYSRDIIGLTYTDSLNLLLVINGVGAVGRIVPNYIADRVGPVNMFMIFGLYGAVGALAWIAVGSSSGLYVWSAVYGIAAGAIQSLFPAGLTSLTTDLSKMGVRMGMVFTINSFSTLTGPPIAGALISVAGGSYLGTQLFTGITILIGTCFIVMVKAALSRKSDKGWRSKV